MCNNYKSYLYYIGYFKLKLLNKIAFYQYKQIGTQNVFLNYVGLKYKLWPEIYVQISTVLGKVQKKKKLNNHEWACLLLFHDHYGSSGTRAVSLNSRTITAIQTWKMFCCYSHLSAEKDVIVIKN